LIGVASAGGAMRAVAIAKRRGAQAVTAEPYRSGGRDAWGRPRRAGGRIGGALVMSVPESEQIDRVDLDRVAAVTVRPLA
jgi:hypothetical protein